MNFEDKTFLVIAPHMDDEVIGCGGTILKYRAVIRRLAVIHMTADQTRCQEYPAVRRALGIDQEYQMALVDGFVSNANKEVILTITDIIQKERPDVVFLPHGKDEHPDHIATNRIVLDAVGKARYWPSQCGGWQVPWVLEYEVWSLQETVSMVVDITEEIMAKQELMRFYQSQSNFDYPQLIYYCGGYRGMRFNKGGFAECFFVRRI